MKRFLMLLLAVSFLFLLACGSEDETSKGYLNVHNHTAGIVTVTVNGAQQTMINGNSDYVFTFEFTGSYSGLASMPVTVAYSGDYMVAGTREYDVLVGESTDCNLDPTKATLEIANDTSALAWVKINNSAVYNINANSSETFDIDMTSAATSNATIIFDGYHVSETTHTVAITAGHDYIDTIHPTKGAIALANNSLDTDIVAINVSLHSSNLWGPNLISSNLEPGSTAIFTVDPNNWDVRVITDMGEEFPLFNNAVALDTTVPLNFSKKSVPQPCSVKPGINGVIGNVQLKIPEVL
jgi:hypothetical protein